MRDHVWGHKIHLNKRRRTEIISYMLPDNGINWVVTEK